MPAPIDSGILPQDGRDFLGEELRHARTEAGLTQRELAEATQYGPSYVAMVETGERLPSAYFAQACDVLFNRSGFFARMLAHMKERDGHPRWFIPYLRLEASATEIMDYSANLIMGMLQTEAYAEAVFRAYCPRESDGQIKERVEARARRRDVLRNDSPPTLWVILDECCLRRQVGGKDAMREQLEFLLQEERNPSTTIQVLPFRSGAPHRTESYTLLRFAEGSDTLYTDTPARGYVIDSGEIVDNASTWFDHARAEALSPDDSTAMLRAILEEQ